MPAFTSTPNVQRQEDVSDDNKRASENSCWLINRIEQLDNGIKAIKRDVIQQMECKINELKSSLIAMIEKLNTHTTYADAIRYCRGFYIEWHKLQRPEEGCQDLRKKRCQH